MNIETAHDRLVVMLGKLKDIGVDYKRLGILEQAVKELYGAAKISVKYKYGDRVEITSDYYSSLDLESVIKAGWHGTVITNEWNAFTNEMTAHVNLDLTEHNETYRVPYNKLEKLD